MSNKKDIHHLIENLILQERETESNPFLATRIMAVIEKMNSPELKQDLSRWKLALVAVSLVAAVFAGVGVGNLYQIKDKTHDIVLMNDDRMENFVFYNEIVSEK